MKSKKFLLEAPIAAVLFAAFFAKLYLDTQGVGAQRPAPRVTRATADFQAQSLRRFNFGFKNAIADSLWVQLLQKASHTRLRRDEVSWEFAQLNAITVLDPKFTRSYTFGASFLSVFRRDRLGAQLILEKWARWAPNNWRSHYMLGCHYFFEQKKYEQASRSILRAASLPDAPPWLNSLGIRLISETGAHFAALQIAIDLYPSMTTLEGKDRLKKRVRSLRFRLLKAAWEKAIEKFPAQFKRSPASTEELVPFVKQELSDLSTALAQLSVHEDLEEVFTEKFHFFYNSEKKSVEFTSNFGSVEMNDLEESGINRSKMGGS